ncbi:MAG: hypothetical protein KDJ52_23780 [Anaerolineae bacterium]|nr:hypothetical protein [Anaerolineae bacterium]
MFSWYRFGYHYKFWRGGDATFATAVIAAHVRLADLDKLSKLPATDALRRQF